MATINLGAIKFNWKGAYNSGTTYAVDDVVSSGGNSYVCIQAHSNQAVGNATAYWNIMSSAGTNGTDGSDGTDVGTTLTTQSDLLYRDGSGLQRLAKGTANQTLQMNAGATAPNWVTASGGTVLQVKSIQTGDYFSTTSGSVGTGAYGIQHLTTTFTPTSSSSHIIVTGMIHATHDSSYCGRGYITYNHSGISETIIQSNKSGNTSNCTFRFEAGVGTSGVCSPSAINLHFTPATTNEMTFKLRIMTSNTGTPSAINGTISHHTNSDDGAYTISSLTFWEIANGITPSVGNYSIQS